MEFSGLALGFGNDIYTLWMVILGMDGKAKGRGLLDGSGRAIYLVDSNMVMYDLMLSYNHLQFCVLLF